VTLEHTFPRWTVPLIEALGDVRSTTRVSHHEEHVHNVWGTETVDFKARKVCEPCNTGWMAALESDVAPILSPMITSTDPIELTDDEAILLATWVTKTALTGTLTYPETDHATPSRYFHEIYRERRPILDSVVWIGAYEVGRYPASHSEIHIPPHGARITGNVGCFAYQVTADDGLAEGLVLPPGDRFRPKLAQIWPLRPRPEIAEIVSPLWAGFEHLGRPGVPMDDDELRFLSQIDLHSWGVAGHERPAPAADSEPTTP
jgi:hypothetical protein